jgi:hypothetical protein
MTAEEWKQSEVAMFAAMDTHNEMLHLVAEEKRAIHRAEFALRAALAAEDPTQIEQARAARADAVARHRATQKAAKDYIDEARRIAQLREDDRKVREAREDAQ